MMLNEMEREEKGTVIVYVTRGGGGGGGVVGAQRIKGRAQKKETDN